MWKKIDAKKEEFMITDNGDFCMKCYEEGTANDEM